MRIWTYNGGDFEALSRSRDSELRIRADWIVYIVMFALMTRWVRERFSLVCVLIVLVVLVVLLVLMVLLVLL